MEASASEPKRSRWPFLLMCAALVVLAGLAVVLGTLLAALANSGQQRQDLARAVSLTIQQGSIDTPFELQRPRLPLHQANPQENTNKTFRLFSQTPRDQANLPNAFEQQALQAFSTGSPEFGQLESQNGNTRYRFAVPLTVDASCLRCHGSQGYREGEIHGGLSFSFDISSSERLNAMYLLGIIVTGLALLFVLILLPVLAKRFHQGVLQTMEIDLSRATTLDDLTGIGNRQYFFKRFDEEFARAIRQNRSLGLIMIDIDHFKDLNEQYGHEVGDQVLQLLASLLQANCRVSDVVARYGGEEFALLLPEVDSAGTQILAEKLRTRVSSATVQLGPQQKPLRFTISLGLACLEAAALKDLVPPTRIVALADAALDKAKHTGRNRVMVH